MTEQQTNLLPFYKGWDAYQDLLVKAIGPLSDKQLALRTAPQLRTVGENAAHIIGTRAGWFHDLMGIGGEEIAAMETWDEPDAPVRRVRELIYGLETTWQMIQDSLAHWTPADLEYVFEGVHDGRPYHLTRQWVIWHLIEHDLHHGGEISFTLGTYNLTGIDI